MRRPHTQKHLHDLRCFARNHNINSCRSHAESIAAFSAGHHAGSSLPIESPAAHWLKIMGPGRCLEHPNDCADHDSFNLNSLEGRIESRRCA